MRASQCPTDSRNHTAGEEIRMIQFNDRGLIPAIVQDAETGRVLMHAYMNSEALQRTIAGPDVWFYSRSRRELWHKGETSGNFLKVVEVQRDCDSDAVLVKASPMGPACHTGLGSCFDSGSLTPDTVQTEGNNENFGPGVLADILDVIRQRADDRPAGSYTVELLESGIQRVAQKVGEEATEVVIASLSQTPDDLANEMADMLYHSMVLLIAAGVSPDSVWKVLAERRH
ncbi:MAG: bifunctional phosphoribosyl-AMP cyclohydrolase/phosphoribosyl-ATP diphosphatase HisIE [Chloroflexi bacterium]|nr:bifunctional phosphoribosyl-AMP cyclohydrolase/phosphoribosyl-ATP diphosphatase HisIE [Chloroflexota bacterium]